MVLNLDNLIVACYYIRTYIPCMSVGKKQNAYTHNGKKQTSNSSSKTCGPVATPHFNYLVSFLGAEEPLLKLLRSAKLQHTNCTYVHAYVDE